MGNFFTLSYWQPEGLQRGLMFGLSAAGKTTILHHLTAGEVVTKWIPTIGHRICEAEFKNFFVTSIDVGGTDRVRQLWGPYYYQDNNFLIFVVDSNDSNRIEEAKEELIKLTNEEDLNGIPLLVVANKQDLPNAISATELQYRLKLQQIQASRPCVVIPSCAMKGDGIQEILDWLSSLHK